MLRDRCMLEALSPGPPAGRADSEPRPTAILVSTVFGSEEVGRQLGSEAYSYHFACRALFPLLRRIGEVIEVSSPESRLDFAVREAHARGLAPIHLSFRPLHHVYLSSLVPNLAFPFWEFPDIPNEDFDDNPRNNWVRIAGRLSGILCASEFTRDAFLRAGVRTPIATVPVPIAPAYFALDPWQGTTSGSLSTTAWWIRAAGESKAAADPWGPPALPRTLRARARLMHEERLRPALPRWTNRALDGAIRSGKQWLGIADEETIEHPGETRLDLSGIVYTSILNPFDPRKNWQDLLSAFLIALADRDDATLVLKLVVPPESARSGAAVVRGYAEGLRVRHRCKLALIVGYLSDAELLDLTRRSAFYLSASRAEGSCLPAQDFLAAGRPLIAPRHTSLAEYFSAEVGFPVDSHPEPAWWPHDGSRRISTTWHRVVWQSLHDQIRASYALAREASSYADMSRRCRDRMTAFAAADRVWPRLQASLEPFADARAAVR